MFTYIFTYLNTQYRFEIGIKRLRETVHTVEMIVRAGMRIGDFEMFNQLCTHTHTRSMRAVTLACYTQCLGDLMEI